MLKSALPHKSAKQSIKAPWIYGANLPRIFIEQCRLPPAKLESNADFASQNPGDKISGIKKKKIKKKYIYKYLEEEEIFIGL